MMCSLLPTLTVNFHFPASSSRTLLWKQTTPIMWAKVRIIAMYTFSSLLFLLPVLLLLATAFQSILSLLQCLSKLLPSDNSLVTNVFLASFPVYPYYSMWQSGNGLGMRQTFSLVCDSELPVSNFCEMCCSSASFCAMMTCNDLSLLSKREILACVWVWWLCMCVCACVWGFITAWTYYHDDYGVSGARIKQTCYTMLQDVTQQLSTHTPQGFCSDWLFSHTLQGTVEASTAKHILSHDLDS